LNYVDRIQNIRALIVNVNLSGSSSTEFKTKELENHFKDSNYHVLWGKVENLSALSDRKTFTNFCNEKMLESVKILILNFEYKWHNYFDNQNNRKLLDAFKKSLPRNWSVYQIIHLANDFYVRYYISPS